MQPKIHINTLAVGAAGVISFFAGYGFFSGFFIWIGYFVPMS